MPLHYYTYYSKEKIKIADKPFAAGGEGKLFKIASPRLYRDKIAKIYHKQKKLSDILPKLKFLMEQESKGLEKQMAFPLDLLMENNQFVGFIMPVVKGEKLELFCQPNQLEKRSIKWKRLNLNSPKGLENRLSVAFNVACLLANIHATKNYTVVDFKPENMLINPYMDIGMVDVDSMQIEEQGELLFRAPVVTIEYAPPEYHLEDGIAGQHFSKSWDNFSLAIILYRLFLQIHPYAASSKGAYSSIVNLHGKVEKGLFVHHPAMQDSFNAVPVLHQRFYDLPESIQRLFIRCFVDGHEAVDQRPTALEWAVELLFCIQRYHNKDQFLEQLTIGKMPILKLQRIPIPSVAYEKKEITLFETDDLSIESTLDTLEPPVLAFSNHQNKAFLEQGIQKIYMIGFFYQLILFMYEGPFGAMHNALSASDYIGLIFLFIGTVLLALFLLLLLFIASLHLSHLTTALLQTIFAPLFFNSHQTVAEMRKNNAGKIPIEDLVSQGKTLQAEINLVRERIERLVKKEKQLYNEMVLLRTNANRHLDAAFERAKKQLEQLNIGFMQKASLALKREDKKALIALAKTLQEEQFYQKLTNNYQKETASIQDKYKIVQADFVRQLGEVQKAFKVEENELVALQKRRDEYFDDQKKIALNFDEITVKNYVYHVWMRGAD